MCAVIGEGTEVRFVVPQTQCGLVAGICMHSNDRTDI